MRSANLTRNAATDAQAARLNGGTVNVYSGTRPATADTALSGNTLLATGAFGSPAFGAAANGVATANAIGQDSSADAGAVPTFARLLTSGGASVADVTVGTSETELIINASPLVQGLIVQFTALTWTTPDGT